MIRDPATGAVLIRANQGHTMKTVAAEKLLTRLTLADVHTYPYVVHGTTARAWPLIKKTGLNKMERNHIMEFVNSMGSWVKTELLLMELMRTN